MNDSFESLQSQGVAFAQRGEFDRAIECFERAIKHNHNSPAARNNLAIALDATGRLPEAIAAWSRAVELAPGYFDATFSLGKALQRAGQRDRALAMLDRAVSLQPANADARFVRGLALLLLGRLSEGFADYAFRERRSRSLLRPLWDGQPQSGKTILLTAEQGLGDCIQFVRYAKDVRARCGRVILECQPALRRLLEGVAGVDELVLVDAPSPAFDFQIALLDLPRVLGTTLQTIPADVPYLHPDVADVARWSARFGPRTAKRAGLAWAGNPDHVNDRKRSIPLSAFEPFVDLPADFVSLQTGPAALQARDSRLKLLDCHKDLTDLSETAALIANLDLIITVDTAIAHLAGAVGKPVWILLPFLPDWRWMFDRTDSPWYPTARLFRQPSPGDWRGVITRVTEELTRQK